ncbi:MAG: DUF721 domain-containing protein [Endomicrobium sp.]|jgi:hypothetical protein|nr:DUF721 domain-containing protein [Endomicrobium sp.]
MTWTSAAEVVISLLKRQFGLNKCFFLIEKIWNKEICISGTKVNGYKNGIISIIAQSSVANSELLIRKKEIIEKLNKCLIGSTSIKNIKVTVK